MPGGLVINITYIFLTNAFISPLVYLLNPVVLVKGIKMCLAKRNQFLTQGEANLLFEAPQVDMAQRYANLMKTVLLTFCYATIIPEAFLIAASGLIFEF